MAINQQLNKLIDQTRGELKEDQTLALATILLYIKSKDANAIAVLQRMGLANQKTALKELLNTYSEAADHSAIQALEYARNEAVSALITFVGHIEDVSLASQAIREAFANSRSITEHVSNANEVNLIRSLVQPKPSDNVLDPAGGIGNLVASLPKANTELQELNLDTATICRMLASIENRNISVHAGNSLIQPVFKESSADYVVMTPPLGLRFGREQIDKIKSAPYLLSQESQSSIPMTAGDSLWLQLALWALNDTGKGYAFLPKGWLFRGGYDAQVREYFIENELIDAVVQLPGKLFNYKGVSPALIILNKAKKKGSPVRFIDAEAAQDDAGIENIIGAEHIADIVQLITTTATDDPRVTEKYAPEIREQDMSLAVNRYITPQTHIEEINFEAESAKLKQLENTYAEAKRQLRALLDN